MYRHLPNALTVCRAALALVFFIVLSHYRYGVGPDGTLIAAFILFIIAAVTDWLDGYLARKWEVVTAFGRIMDPFCDKVLVLGAFIFLAGPRFVNPAITPEDSIFWAMIPNNTVSGVYPWMVALMLARELLVTGIRGELEAMGIEFGAKLSGKLKTVLQLIAVPTIIAIVWLDPLQSGHAWMILVRNGIVYATVIVTLISGWPYVRHAMTAMRATPDDKETPS